MRGKQAKQKRRMKMKHRKKGLSQKGEKAKIKCTRIVQLPREEKVDIIMLTFNFYNLFNIKQLQKLIVNGILFFIIR